MQVKGTIIYSLVAKIKGGVILSDYTEYTGNFQQTLMLLLQKLKPNMKISYTNEE